MLSKKNDDLNLDCVGVLINMERSSFFTLSFNSVKKAKMYFNKDLLIFSIPKRKFSVSHLNFYYPFTILLSHNNIDKLDITSFEPYFIKLDSYNNLYISYVHQMLGRVNCHLEIKLQDQNDAGKLEFLRTKKV